MSRLAFLLTMLSVVAVAESPPERILPPKVEGKGPQANVLVTDLKNPESVAIAPDGRVFVTTIGEFDKDGDGAVMLIQDGKPRVFATGMNDPKGMVAWQKFLFVADKNRIWRVDDKGQATVIVGPEAFPRPPLFLNDIEADTNGNLYVADSGNLKGQHGAIYRIDPKQKVTLVVDHRRDPRIGSPNGLRLINEYHLHVADFASGKLFQVRLSDGKVQELADGMGGADGITFDHHGRIFVSDWSQGRVFVIPRQGEKPILLASGFQAAADLCLSRDGKSLLVPDMKAGTLVEVPIRVPGQEVREDKLSVSISPAFPQLQFEGWKGVTDAGQVVPHRPIILTHAGDGTGRLFLATQQGVVHVFANDPNAKKTRIFLDMQNKVRYSDNDNEEGFLGLAFHPRYKENGELFVFYTPKNQKLTNVLSRFRVSMTDPDHVDPASEEVLMSIKRPFTNHDGGTICFGPDGYLYIAVGDGGAANDPFGNGQKLNSVLGKILRIDVNRKDAGRPYAIPGDNPFVGRSGARPEIFAYGFRNVWRMSFDSGTGQLWAADVGQNLWEEINLVQSGGNYGWNPREGLHPFGTSGVEANKDMVEPIWEYHHDIGKSITGGHVYRGKNVPELDGHYLYADYVSGNVWALRYDSAQKRVTGNHLLRSGGFPVFSFGEDDKGEVYLLTSTATGKGIFRFTRSKP